MVSTRMLKSRINSVKTTRQTTKAMQLVAASKMRKAQEADKESTPYTKAASELLTYFASQGVTNDHPLFRTKGDKITKRLVIVIASDKGLAGAYNTNVLKQYLNTLSDAKEGSVETKTIAIGKKASQFAAKLKGVEIVSAYEDIADKPSGHTVKSILDMAITHFSDEDVDAVDIVFTEFISSIVQRAVVRQLLPAGFQRSATVSDSVKDAKYEPSIQTVLDGVVNRLLSAQLFQAILDAKASEHSMRMIAMKNATDNASDLIEDLTLAMHKARQGAITQELAEISGGVEALND